MARQPTRPAARSELLEIAAGSLTLDTCRRRQKQKKNGQLPTAAQLTYAGHGVKKLGVVYDPDLLRAFPVSCMWVYERDEEFTKTGCQSIRCKHHATYVFGMGARHPRYYCTQHAKLILTNQERHKTWSKKPKRQAEAIGAT